MDNELMEFVFLIFTFIIFAFFVARWLAIGGNSFISWVLCKVGIHYQGSFFKLVGYKKEMVYEERCPFCKKAWYCVESGEKKVYKTKEDLQKDGLWVNVE